MNNAFLNQLRRAEGTIARASGGRKSWDPSALRETALSAMRGDLPRCSGMSPGETRRMAEAFRIIQARTSAAHRKEAAAR